MHITAKIEVISDFRNLLLHSETVNSAEQRKAPAGRPSFTIFRAGLTLGDSNLSGGMARMCRRLSGDFPVFRVSISPMPFSGSVQPAAISP